MKLAIMTLCFILKCWYTWCLVWWPWGNIPHTPLPWNTFVHSFMWILAKPADVRNRRLACLTKNSYSKHRVSNKGKLYLVSNSHCVIVGKFLPTCSETWPWASGHRHLPCHAMLILQYCFISNLMPMIFHKLQWNPLQSPHQRQFSEKLQSRKRNLLRDRKVIYLWWQPNQKTGSTYGPSMVLKPIQKCSLCIGKEYRSGSIDNNSFILGSSICVYKRPIYICFEGKLLQFQSCGMQPSCLLTQSWWMLEDREIGSAVAAAESLVLCSSAELWPLPWCSFHWQQEILHCKSFSLTTPNSSWHRMIIRDLCSILLKTHLQHRLRTLSSLHPSKPKSLSDLPRQSWPRPSNWRSVSFLPMLLSSLMHPPSLEPPRSSLQLVLPSLTKELKGSDATAEAVGVQE